MSNQAKSLFELKNSLVDYARPNRFDLEFTRVPEGLESTELGNAGSHAKSATIGSSAIGEILIQRLGKRWQYPGDVTFGELSIIFRTDIGYKLFNEIKKWQEAIVKVGSSSEINSLKAKDGVLKIYQLSHTNNEDKVASWTFYNVYPATISEISFDMENDTSIQEFTTNFFYSYYDFESFGYDPTTGSGILGGVNKIINFVKGFI